MSWSEVRTFLRDDKGRVYVNPSKQFIQPFELPTDAPNQIITLGPGLSAGPFPLTARYDGPIEVFYVKAVVYDNANVPVTDYNIRWFLEHPGKRIQFMNRATSLIACAGDGGRPYVLPETIFIPAVQALNVTFFNDDLVNTRKVEFVLGGVKMYANAAPTKLSEELWSYVQRRERTYTYFQTTDAPLVMAAAALDVPGFMTVPDDADLEIFKLTAQATGNFRAQVIDSQSDRGVTGAKIHGSLLFGGHQAVAAGGGLGGSGGVFPARWASTFLVRRSVKLQVNFDNLTAALNTVQPVFAGRKITYT